MLQIQFINYITEYESLDTKKQPINHYQLFFFICKFSYEATTVPLKERVLGVLLSLVVTFTVFTKAPALAAL